MTKLLDKAIEAIRTLTPEEQDAVAHLMLEWKQLNEDEGEDIDAADLEAVERGLDDLKQGRIATQEEVNAAFKAIRK